MDTNFIIEGILGGLLVMVSFFLKTLHSDLKQVIEDTVENKTKVAENKANIDLIKLQSEGKLDQLKETTELQIQQLTKSIDALVGEMHTINKAIMHLNGNFKMQSQGMADMFDKLMDKKK